MPFLRAIRPFLDVVAAAVEGAGDGARGGGGSCAAMRQKRHQNKWQRDPSAEFHHHDHAWIDTGMQRNVGIQGKFHGVRRMAG